MNPHRLGGVQTVWIPAFAGMTVEQKKAG